MSANSCVLRWSVVLVMAVQPALAAKAAERAPDELAPKDAGLYFGWTGAKGGWEILGLADAFIRSEFVGREVLDDGSREALRRSVALFDRLARFTAAGVAYVDDTGERPTISYGMVVAADDAADSIAADIEAYLQSWNPLAGPMDVKVGGAALRRLSAEGGKPTPMWGVHKGAVILASNEAVATKLLARLDGAAPSIREHELFAKCAKQAGAVTSGWRAHVFYEMPVYMALLSAIVTTGDPAPQPANLQKLTDAFGMKDIPAAFVELTEGEGGMRLNAFARVTGRDGIYARMISGPPLTDADLAVIPKDASSAAAISFDPKLIWEAVLQAAEASDPDARGSIEGAEAAAAMSLGFSPVHDLLPAFGDTWVFYTAPSNPGVLFTGIVVVADADDAPKLHGMLTRAVTYVASLAAESPLRIVQRQVKYGAHEVNYVLLGGVPMPLAPAWGFVDGRVVFGLLPQTVGAAMRQADPAARKSSLLDNTDFADARKTLNRPAWMITYTEPRAAAQLWFALASLARTAAAAITAGEPREYDLGAAPLYPESPAASARGCTSISSTDQDGVYSHSIGLTPQSYVASPAMSTAIGAIAASILLPSLSRARFIAKRSLSMSNLRVIGAACMTYAIDAPGEAFPESLDVLVNNGMLTAEQLVSPLDPSPASPSYVYISGQTMSGDARNVLAYEADFSDNQQGALFLDGHVELMDRTALRDAVRATYERLGRPQDIPAEFRQ